eukprot:scaffold180647_cov51-Attheya_sp.AAC.1
MDLHGGVLNYEGIEILRLLEHLGQKYFRTSILPSTSRIQRFQRKMNKIGETIVPFDSIMTSDGNGGSLSWVWTYRNWEDNLLEELIEYCIPTENDTTLPVEPHRKERWFHCIPKYRAAMLKLRQHKDFTDDDITTFQNDFDIYFQDWIGLHGKNGVTNYIHMLSAGWESLNNLIKSFWFRCTGRGGATGAGKGQKSKLNSVAKWLQHRMMWVGGWEEDSILAEWEKQKDAAVDAAAATVAADAGAASAPVPPA